MRLRKPAATEIVLGLLCLMYLITYVDRTNVATAAGEIRRELKLTATQWGYIASAFGYPYILFQVFGGWVGDRFGQALISLLGVARIGVPNKDHDLAALGKNLF